MSSIFQNYPNKLGLPNQLEKLPQGTNYESSLTGLEAEERNENILKEYGADPVTEQNIWASAGNPNATIQHGNISWSLDSYSQALSNMRKNNPRAAREQALFEATERARQTLEGNQKWNDNEIERLTNLGATPYEIEEAKQHQADLANMSPQERLQNYDARRNGDFENTYDDAEFANNLEMKSLAEIKALYGQEVADYVFQKTKQEYALKAQAEASIVGEDKDLLTWGTAKDVGNAIGRKGVEFGAGVVDTVDWAIDGNEALERQRYEPTFQSAKDWFTQDQSNSFKQAENREHVRSQDLDNYEISKREEALEQGKSEEDANREARLERHLQGFTNAFKEGKTNAASAAEITADLALISTGSGAIAKTAGAGAKAAVKSAQTAKLIKDTNKIKQVTKTNEVANLNKEAASKLAQDRLRRLNTTRTAKNPKLVENGKSVVSSQAEKQAILSKARYDIKNSSLVQNEIVKGANQEATKVARAFLKKNKDIPEKIATKWANTVTNVTHKAGVVALGGNMEASEALKQGYDNIMSIPDKEFLDSPRGKQLESELRKEFGITDPNLNFLRTINESPEFKGRFKQAKQQIAGDVASESYAKVFAISGSTQLLTSGLESKIAGISKRGADKSYLKTILKDAAKETFLQELPESISGEVLPKEIANKALGTEKYDSIANLGFTVGKTLVAAGLGTGGISAVSNLRTAKENTKQAVKKVIPTDKTKTKTETEIKNPKAHLVNEKTKTAYDIATKIEQGTATAEDKAKLKEESAKIIKNNQDKISNYDVVLNNLASFMDTKTEAITEESLNNNKDLQDIYVKVRNILTEDDGIKSIEKFEDLTQEEKEQITKMLNFDKATSKFFEITEGKIHELNKANLQHAIYLDEEGASKGRAKFYNMFIGSGNKTNRESLKTDSDFVELTDSNGEIKRYSKQAVVEELINSIGSIDTISEIEKGKHKAKLQEVANAIKHVSALVDYAGYTESTKGLKALQNVLDKVNTRINDNELSDTEAQTLYEQFVGTNQMRGLIQYGQEAIRNGGTLTPESQKLLNEFMSSQNKKLLAVEKAIKDLELKGKDNPNYIADTGIKNQDGKKLEWRYADIKKALNYRNIVKNTLGDYEQVARSIRDAEFVPQIKEITNRYKAMNETKAKKNEPTVSETNSNEALNEDFNLEDDNNVAIDSMFSMFNLENDNTNKENSTTENFTSNNKPSSNTKTSEETKEVSESDLATETKSKNETETEIKTEVKPETDKPIKDNVSQQSEEDTEEGTVEDTLEERLNVTKDEENDTESSDEISNDLALETDLSDTSWAENAKGFGLNFIERHVKQDTPNWKSTGKSTDKFIKYNGQEIQISNYAYMELAKRGLDLLNPVNPVEIESNKPSLDNVEAKTEKDKLSLYALQTIKHHINNFFIKNTPVLLQNGKLNSNFGINGLLNFARITGKHLDIHPRIKEGMTLAIAKAIVSSRSTSKTNIEVLEESLGVIADGLDVSYISGFKIDTPNVYDIGIYKDRFIADLGQSILENSGLKLGISSNSIQYRGIVQSLGLEAYNILTEHNLVSTVSINGEGISNKTGLEYVQFAWHTSDGYKLNKSTNIGLILKHNLTNEFSKKLLGETKNDLTNTLVYSSEDEVPTFSKSGDASQEFSFNKNTKEFIDIFSNQEWKIDSDFYELMKADEDFFDYATGGKADVKESQTEAYKNELAKINAVGRQRHILEEAITTSGIDTDKIRFKFQYFASSVSRLMDGSDIRPQSYKVNRELITPTQAIMDNPEFADTFLIDSNSNGVQGLIENVKEIAKDVSAFNIESLEDKTKLKNATVMAFVLGISQALGDKIEKKSYEQILDNLPKLLEKKVVADMLNALRTGNYSKPVATAFYNEFGNSSPRALKALNSIVKYEKSNGTYQPTLFLEADGITNGFHNIFMQFGLYTDPTFSENLAITGYATPDFMNSSDYSEGSADIYTKVNDLYQQVADNITNTIKTNLPLVLSVLPKEIDITNESAGSLLYKLPQLNLGKAVSKDNIKHYMNVIGALSLLGEMVDSKTNKPLASMSLSDIVKTLENNLTNNISRGFSKLGVTPKGYSAGLKGVNNQLSKEVISMLNANIFSLSQEMNENKLKNILFSLSALGINKFKVGNQNYNAKDLIKLSNEDILTGLNNIVKSNKKELVNASIAISSILNDTTDNRVDLTLKASNATLAMIDPLAKSFSKRLADQIKNAIEKRNIDKGYVVNGEIVSIEAEAPLSRKEMRSIFKNEQTLPVIANAFSEDAQLLDELIELGSSLTKTQFKDISSLSGSITSLSKYNRLHLTTYIQNKVKEYISAGASAFTSTVITTESKSQADTQKEMNKLGISGLDVFDGGDSFGWVSAFMGNALNKNLLKAHQNYSIIGAFYDMYQRADLTNLTATLETPKVLTELDNFFKNGVKTENVEQIEDFVRSMGQALKSLYDLGIITEQPLVLQTINEVFNQIKQDQFVPFDTLDIVRNAIQSKELTSSIVKYMNGLRELGAQREATQELLKNTVGQYNAFGGASRGVQTSLENEKAKELLDNYLENGVGSYIEFSQSDKTLIDKMNKAKDKFKEQHPLIESDVKLNNDLNDKITFTLNDFLNSFKPNTDSLTGKLHKAIKEMVSNNRNLTITLKDGITSNGYYDSETNSIVLNQDRYNNLSDTGKVELVMHEAVHAILADNLHQYFTGGRMKSSTHNAIKGLIGQAQGFIQTGLNFSVVQKGIKQNTSDLSVLLNSGLSIEAALISSLNFAFNVAPKQLNKTEVAKLQEEALHEFVAYSFTNPKLINKHYNHRVSGLNKNTSTFQKFRNAVSKIISLVRNFVENIIGLKKPDSRLSAMLEQVYTISLDNNDYGSNKTRFNNLDLSNNSTTEKALNNFNGNPEFTNYLSSLINEAVTGQSEVLSTFNYEDKNGQGLNYEGAAEAYIKAKRGHKLSRVPAYIRGLGISMSKQEEQAFQIMYPLVAAANTSAQGKQAISNFLSHNSNLLDKLPNAQLEKLNKVKKLGLDPISLLVTLALTNEQLYNTLETKLDKKAILHGKVNPVEFASNLASFSYRVSMTGEQQDILRRKNLEKRIRANKTYKYLNDKFGSVGAFIESVVAEEEIGANGEHTFASNFINGLARRQLRKNGKPTWFSSFVDLLMGERADTHDIASWHNEAILKTATHRETVVTTAQIALAKNFNRKLSVKETQALAKGITENNGIYLVQNVSKDELSNALKNETHRQQLSQQIQNNLQGHIVNLAEENQIPLKDAQQVFNYLVWQSKGLGDLLTTNQAKAVNNNSSNHILGNARAIASLKMLSALGLGKHAQVFNNEKTISLIRQLSSVESIKNLDENTKTDLEVLVSEDYKGLRAFAKEAASVVNQNTDNNSLLGFDGITSEDSDNLYDSKVVNPNDEHQINILENQGYTLHEELPNGDLIYFSNGVKPKNFTVGMLGLTEMTNQNVDIISLQRPNSKGYRLNDTDSIKVTQSFRQEILKAVQNSNYYDGLQTQSHLRPLNDETGLVSAVYAELPTKTERELIPSTQNGIEAIAKYTGRVAEQKAVQLNNRKMIDNLNQKYRNDFDKDNWVGVDKNLKIHNAHPKYAKKLEEIIQRLPNDTKEYIKENGFAIPLYAINNSLGYMQINFADLLLKDDINSETVKYLRDAFVGIISAFGGNPTKVLNQLQTIMTQTASLTKETILMRSLIVPAGNALSNVIHLTNKGVPLKDIIKGTRDTLVEVKRYQQNQNTIYENQFKLQNGSLTADEARKLKLETDLLIKANNNSNLHQLIQAGLLSSITTLEAPSTHIDRYTIRSKLMSKAGLEDISNNAPKLVKEALMFKDSSTYTFMKNFMDYGDFVGKAILAKHYASQGMDKNKILAEVREEFVDYSRNRGALFDMLNSSGLTWFLAYKVGITKVIAKAIINNPIRTLATVAGANTLVGTMPILDNLIQVVPEQMIMPKHFIPFGSYQTNPTNLFTAPESHWLYKLVESL